MEYQWYPGHMSKAKRQMKEDISLIDVVIELVDARIPFSSKNPDMNELAKGKARVLLLNKADLADEARTRQYKKYYEAQGYQVVSLNAKAPNTVKSVTAVVMEACKEKIERDRKRGIIGRPIRAMIVGIPNVGKSTFINTYAGKACAKTGNKPGVTKGRQWIRLNKNLELLDTPGILWPKFEDQMVGLRIALIGSINEDILNVMELAEKLLAYLYENYPNAVMERYKVEGVADGEECLIRIAEKRACKKKGGELDLEKAAGFVMDDFRAGRLGRITLEVPQKQEVVEQKDTKETVVQDIQEETESEQTTNE